VAGDLGLLNIWVSGLRPPWLYVHPLWCLRTHQALVFLCR